MNGVCWIKVDEIINVWIDFRYWDMVFDDDIWFEFIVYLWEWEWIYVDELNVIDFNQ